MILKKSIRNRTTPETLFRFFEEMETNYTRWHPGHLSFEWIEGRGVKEGVVFVFEEKINGKHIKQNVIYTRVVEERYIEFAPTSRVFRLLLPRMIFRINPEHNECRFEQEIHIRTGPIGRWLNRKEFEAVKQHMK